MRQGIDASALLAYLMNEAGGDILIRDQRPFCLCSVNLTEVLIRLIDRGLDVDDMLNVLRGLPIGHHAYDVAAPGRSADLRPATRALGMSLGDRACLALARRLDLPVLTGDRKWAELELGLDVRLIR